MELYNFTLYLAQEAGRLLEEKKRLFSVTYKHDNPRDIVTNLDIEIGNYITEQIRANYPEHGIHNEEADSIKGNELTWVIDPIDGSANFARRLPQYAVVVGLLRNGEPITGAVLDPISGELFSFDIEMGAFLNGEQIGVSEQTELKRSFVLFAAGRKPEQFEWAGESLTKLLSNTNKVKNFGSSALSLSYLAAGRLEAVVAGTFTTMDIAAAIGLVRTAGGEVYDAAGSPVALKKTAQRIYATNNPEIAKQLRSLLETKS